MKEYVHTKVCTWMLIAILFILPKTEHNVDLEIGGWINKLWYVYTTEYGLAIRSEWLIHVTTLMILKIIVLFIYIKLLQKPDHSIVSDQQFSAEWRPGGWGGHGGGSESSTKELWEWLICSLSCLCINKSNLENYTL